MGKPPLRWYYLDLEMINESNHVKYFLLPYYGEDTLKAVSQLKGNAHSNQADIEGKMYPDSLKSKNSIVELVFYGKGKDRCRIFAISPNSSAHLRNYVLDMWRDIESLYVLEAEDIIVNDKTKLKDALPYPIVSSPNAFVADNQVRILSTKILNPVERIPMEEISFMRLKNPVSFRIPIIKRKSLGDSLLSELNLLHLKGGKILTNQKNDDSDLNIKTSDISNYLHNAGIRIVKSNNRYLMAPYFSLKLIENMNDLVSAAGDTDHTPEGMASTGESITMFRNLKETLKAYGIEYYWDNKMKRYRLK